MTKINTFGIVNPDAEILLTGHTHDKWYMPITRTRINSRGTLSFDNQYHVKCASYKDEFKDGFGGFHVETGKPPKPKGGFWIDFKAIKEDRKNKVDFSLREAK